MPKKNNKGIALITLVVAVLMMLIISSVIIYNTTSHIKIQSLNNMYNDIQILNEQVLLYYSKNNELPIVEDSYQFGKPDEEIGGILLGYQPTSFYVIDINKINKNILSEYNSTALKYGKDYLNEAYKDNNNDDVYIININTHQIFYVRGIIVDNNTYYTIPGETEYEKYDVAQTIANPPILENELQPAKYGESNTLVGTNKYDKDWYDYSERSDLSRWARAQISDTEIYMWVPRFTYNPKTNEYAFLKGKTNTPIDGTKDITEEWRILGAFQSEDGRKLSGIWLDVSDGTNSINDVISKVYELAGKDNTGGNINVTITGKDSAYYNPVIPVGFRTVQTESASWRSNDGVHVNGWNEGLVIEDEDGNEFVWVPVDGTNVKYEKWIMLENCYNIDNAIYILDDDLSNKIMEEWNWNYEKSQEKIKEYGGFYVARYEAGIPKDKETALNTATKEARDIKGVPVSRKNQIPWNFISYSNAKNNAEEMYNDNYVKSGLITGVQWDVIMKWLKNANIDVENDSKNWGNYNNAPVKDVTLYSINGGTKNGFNRTSPTEKDTNTSWLLTTGNSKYTSRKNIYDIAGNVWEWTSEKYSDKYILRGGGYYNNSSQYPANYRFIRQDKYQIVNIAFRCVLYIK